MTQLENSNVLRLPWSIKLTKNFTFIVCICQFPSFDLKHKFAIHFKKRTNPLLIKDFKIQILKLYQIYTLLVCPFVSNRRHNCWTDLAHILRPHMTQGRLMNAQNYKIHENKIVNLQKKILLFHQRENSGRLSNNLKLK